MNKTNIRILPFAAMFLLTGSGAIAQTTNIPAQQEKVKQLAAQDVSTFVSEQTYELPWTPILERDIAFKKRVWREIDAGATENKAFRYDASNQNGSLVSMLIEGAVNGKFKVYDAVADDRFTKVLSKEEVIALITPGKGNAGSNPAGVSKYRIKEDWLYLPKENKMVVRIIGLAPVAEVKGSDGKISEQPLFWVYYPDTRNYMAESKIANIKDANDASWDMLFENRNFKSKIVKVSSPSGATAYKQ